MNLKSCDDDNLLFRVATENIGFSINQNCGVLLTHKSHTLIILFNKDLIKINKFIKRESLIKF